MHIVAITGKSGSGKDTIAKVLVDKYGYKFVRSTTTRPMRSNEEQGREYYFISEDEFRKLLDNGQLAEYRAYNTIENGKETTWYYGIEKKEINIDKNKCVCVVDLQGLADLQKIYADDIISFYVVVAEEVRKERAMSRDSNFEEEEWNRRVRDDDVKFVNAEKQTHYTVHNYDLDACIDEMIRYIIKRSEKNNKQT